MSFINKENQNCPNQPGVYTKFVFAIIFNQNVFQLELDERMMISLFMRDTE